MLLIIKHGNNVYFWITVDGSSLQYQRIKLYVKMLKYNFFIFVDGVIK